jgi:hypothetical protein
VGGEEWEGVGVGGRGVEGSGTYPSIGRMTPWA